MYYDKKNIYHYTIFIDRFREFSKNAVVAKPIKITVFLAKPR